MKISYVYTYFTPIHISYKHRLVSQKYGNIGFPCTVELSGTRKQSQYVVYPKADLNSRHLKLDNRVTDGDSLPPGDENAIGTFVDCDDIHVFQLRNVNLNNYMHWDDLADPFRHVVLQQARLHHTPSNSAASLLTGSVCHVVSFLADQLIDYFQVAKTLFGKAGSISMTNEGEESADTSFHRTSNVADGGAIVRQATAGFVKSIATLHEIGPESMGRTVSDNEHWEVVSIMEVNRTLGLPPQAVVEKKVLVNEEV